MELKQRIEDRIEKLAAMRDQSVGFYLDELVNFTPNDGNPNAAMRAGIVHDLDKHITNLELELKRMEAVGTKQSEVALA